jgi:hypothetical protein
MKNPIVISTLEEDFRKIGLIKANLTESAAPQEDSLDERNTDRRHSMITRGGVKMRTQRTSFKKKKYNKRYAHTTGGKAAERRAGRKAETSKGKRKARKAEVLGIRKGTRKESVDSVELMKSFANAAIIAEKLQTIFTEWYEADIFDAEGDEVLENYIETLEVIAEEFATAATSLNEGVESDEETLVALFNEGLETVLDAVDLYEESKSEIEDEASDDEEMDAEDDEEGND